MLRFLQAAFWAALRMLSRLRYRVEVKGVEKLRGLRGPTLVMPNHPGYADPVLVLSHLRLAGAIRPVATERMYRHPLLYPMMRLVQALEVPELAEQSHGARQQTLAMIDAIVAGIERGDNFLIYPSGRVQWRGREVIGAARAASEILERCPQANVVLVRSRGVWGSMFSWAQTASSPSLMGGLIRGFGWALLSLGVFLPRRRVTITVDLLDRRELPDVSRDKLNRYLEAWYNCEGPETPVYVPYHVFGRREFSFPDLDAGEQVDVEKIRPATIRAVNEIIEDHLGRSLSDDEKQPQTALDQIGLDSLDRMDTALKIEDRFGFHSNQVATTIGELWALAEGLASRGTDAATPAPAKWAQAATPGEPLEVLGETIPESFVRRALRHPDDMAIADRLSGVLTYRRLLVGARLLSRRVAAIPGHAVGVLLPASVGADVVYLAIQLAGKLPVMLNWTTGPANLAHAVRKLEVQRVLTSRKLIDRLGIHVEGAEYVFVEDLRSQVGKLEAVAAMLATYCRPGSFLRSLPQCDPDDPAVVLFTSGSESTPKAVPLSHRNLICNLRASIKPLVGTRADSLLSLLPPFHSFGLMAGLLAPVLAGFRAVYYPDPTDARGLVHTLAQYRATLVFTTPTFLGYMLGVAKPDDLQSLRVIVTGAEKCPEAVFARARELAPQATILEGYGITECSPIVAGNCVGRVKADTVGPPVESVEVCVVHPESHQPLPPGTIGMLLVRGTSVFSGYLNHDGPEPFVEVEGKRWYNTGDLVEIDDEHYIHFRGRLKRFLKAGGEMISLPALEEPFSRLRPPTEDGPQVAVEGIETPQGRWIVLFATGELSVREANAILSETGFRGVMRLDEVVRLDAIPILGTGKTDYKVLRKLVADRVQASDAK